MSKDPQSESRRKISKLRKTSAAWLYSNEVDILESFEEQLDKNRSLDLTEGQRNLLDAIKERVAKRREGKEVRGGSPGSGRDGVR